MENGQKSEHVITQDKNHIPWNKNHIPPLGSFAGFPARAIVLWQEDVRDTRNALHVGDKVPMDLKYVCQQYFTCICYLGFIRYNKTLIACGFRKYEKLFTHEYHILLGPTLGEYDTLGWINFHISLTSMQ